MEKPKIEARNGVVVAWVAQVQKSQELLIDKEKPKKSVVLPGAAVKSEIKVRWIAKCGENMPGRGDQQDD